MIVKFLFIFTYFTFLETVLQKFFFCFTPDFDKPTLTTEPHLSKCFAMKTYVIFLLLESNHHGQYIVNCEKCFVLHKKVTKIKIFGT